MARLIDTVGVVFMWIGAAQVGAIVLLLLAIKGVI